MKKECIFLLCTVENWSKMRCINPLSDKKKEGIAEDRVYEEKGYFANITYYNKHNKKEKEKRKIGEGREKSVSVVGRECAQNLYPKSSVRCDKFMGQTRMIE